MSNSVDARGVKIEPGDTAVWGFGVGRSVAMAEGVVMGAPDPLNRFDTAVSLTPSGRVRVRVVRRSYGGGEKPVVDVAPDRLVVLKSAYNNWEEYRHWRLPDSPLPTQAEENRRRIENLVESYTSYLRATVVPDRLYYDGWDLAAFHAYAARRLAKLRRELKELEGI